VNKDGLIAWFLVGWCAVSHPPLSHHKHKISFGTGNLYVSVCGSQTQKEFWDHSSTLWIWRVMNRTDKPCQTLPNSVFHPNPSDSKKNKTKRKRMMGWIKNGPKKI
jgi:hypothetical protein